MRIMSPDPACLARSISPLETPARVPVAAPSGVGSTEAFYHALVDSLPHFVFRKDPHGRITYTNQLLCEALAKDLEEILGKTEFDLFPATLAQEYQTHDRAQLSGPVEC